MPLQSMILVIYLLDYLYLVFFLPLYCFKVSAGNMGHLRMIGYNYTREATIATSNFSNKLINYCRIIDQKN